MLRIIVDLCASACAFVMVLRMRPFVTPFAVRLGLLLSALTVAGQLAVAMTPLNVARCDLHIAEVDPGVEHGGDEGVRQHVRVHPRKSDSGLLGEAPQPTGGAVPIHPGSAGGQQDGA
ncbi:MAG TPA: hypothetical protein VLA89_10750, partial [Gemmatimonadales bacterium]|nr:hypothetical protein [Gemmatimonadales bacterium]